MDIIIHVRTVSHYPQEDKFIDVPHAVCYLTCRGGVVSLDRLRPREYNSRTPHGMAWHGMAVYGSETPEEADSGEIRSTKSCDRVNSSVVRCLHTSTISHSFADLTLLLILFWKMY
jgi:hypothetical protein